MKTNTKLLKTVEDLNLYVHGYNDAFANMPVVSKYLLNIERLKKYSRVRGFYLNNLIVGGYIINTSSLRNLETLTSEQIAYIDQKYGLNNLVEITGLWRTKQFSTFTLFAWPLTFIDILISNKKYIVGSAYPAHGMTPFYLCAKPEIIEKGEEKNRLMIFVYTRTQYFKTLVYGISSRISEALFNTKIVKR